MWILPKQLHTSAYVPDTAALISDLDEQSQICEPSLLARSKPSLARTWSQKWRRDSWTQHLSGRILKPSHGQTFVTAWTSSLEVIPASHFQQPGSDSDETTPDTSGLGLQMELELCDPESASSRTSRDTSASDSERSSANWKALVTLRRGEYSQRVKSAHLTNASECSSWPTATVAEAGKISCTPNYGQTGLSNHPAIHGYSVQRNKLEKSRSGQAAPVNPSTDGSRLESWLTPRANEPEGDPNFVARNADRGEHCHGSLGSQVRSAEALARAKLKGGCKNLREEVHQWATPNTMDCLPSRSYEAMKRQATVGERKNRSKPGNLREQIDPLMCQAYKEAQAEANQWATPQSRDFRSAEGNAERFSNPDRSKNLNDQMITQTSGKLNPRWVETLMGLPVGWVMPSCLSPLIIAPMSCDCLETESCQPPQPELF